MTKSSPAAPDAAQLIRESLSPSARARGQKVRWMQSLVRGDAREGCRDWPWGLNNKGYGAIRWEGATQKATHVILDLDGRPRPHPRAFALHSCDRPICVAPWHLRWGTPADNAVDREARGRARPAQGMASGLARLTDDDVRAIRASGETLRALGTRYGVHFTVIQKVRAGKTWRHLLPDEEGSCRPA
jgi:hypothetical protein